jgi:hypothetical protein
MSISCVSHVSALCFSYMLHIPELYIFYGSHISAPCISYVSRVPAQCTSYMSHIPELCIFCVSHIPALCIFYMSHIQERCISVPSMGMQYVKIHVYIYMCAYIRPSDRPPIYHPTLKKKLYTCPRSLSPSLNSHVTYSIMYSDTLQP